MSVPPSRIPARARRPQVVPAGGSSTGGSSQLAPQQILIERTPWVEFWENFTGEQGASLLLSCVLHAIVLALLAIPVLETIRREESITTVIQPGGDGGDGTGAIGDPGQLDMALTQLEPAGGDALKDVLLETPELTPSLIPDIGGTLLPSAFGTGLGTGADAGGGGGGGGGTGSGGFSGVGIRIAEPGNAVRAGSFSVWAWPITGTDNRGRVLHGEPGDSPAPLQPYHIVIRLKVPEGKTSVSVSDFSGKVVGTDRYVQKIPQDAWYYNTEGTLVRGRGGRKIPVIEGTAELLIRVPGATVASVRDTITVACKLIDDEQKIELEFRDRNTLESDADSAVLQLPSN